MDDGGWPELTQEQLDMEAAGGAGQAGEADQRTSSGSVGEEARKERSKEEQRRLNQERHGRAGLDEKTD